MPLELQEPVPLSLLGLDIAFFFFMFFSVLYAGLLLYIIA
jgi:hypothetical protein